MAVLQKIRERSVLLLVVIGFSLLAFIVGDFLMSGSSLTTNSVGSVNGETISTQEYMGKIQRLESSGQATGSQAHESIWGEEVRRILFAEQFENAGLRLGKDQLINFIKTIPNFANNSQFLNDAGQFDTFKFNNFLAELKKDDNSWKGWKEYEKSLEELAKEQIYYNMVKGTVYTTNLEAKYAYKKEADRSTFDYVTLPYTTIKDEEATVSDSDIQAYIEKHQKQFKSPDYRTVEYVFVPSKPSAEDQNAVKAEVQSLMQSSVVFNAETQKNDTIAGFSNTDNLAVFVNNNSDIPYEETYYTKEQLAGDHQEALFNLSAGEVYGPYLFNDYYCLTRLTDRKSRPETVDTSHILIAYGDNGKTREEAEAIANDLLTKVNASNFAAMATEHSDDPGSKDKGGKYENVPKGQMVPAFDEYIFNNPVGKIGMVETQLSQTKFGFHILKVDAQSENKIETVQLATVAKAIQPSSATQDELYKQASNFELKAAEGDFSKVASDMGLIAHPATAVTAFADQLPAIEGTHGDAIAWAYNKSTDIGDIKRFDGSEGHLIVRVAEVNESGLLGVNDARKKVEPILRKQKKAELIKKQMAGATLEEIAKNAKSNVQAGETNGSTQTVGFVKEPKVAGYTFGTEAGKVSELIEGENGVYAIKTKEVVTAPELPNYNAYKTKVVGANKNTVQSAVFSAIYNNAEIKDKRAKVLR